MTEDILEQLVDGWFKRRPSTFTKHNIKYRPDISKMDKETKKKYCVNSDIDVLAIELIKNQTNVSVVNCKSWQGGFDVKFWYNKLSNVDNHKDRNSGREYWKPFRELTHKIWARAFREKIFSETNSRNFTYYIAVTKLINKEKIDDFKKCDFFLKNLKGESLKVNIEFLPLEKMITDIYNKIQKTALEATEIGRFIQLIKAANMTINPKIKKLSAANKSG